MRIGGHLMAAALVVIVASTASCAPGTPATATAIVPADPGAPEGATRGEASPVGAQQELRLASSAFAPGATIPQKYTCDGEDVSPPLSWSDPPQGTRSFALLCEDPDAPSGTWVHWVLFNLPAQARSLPEDLPPENRLPDGSAHGQNSWGRLGYGGPCPPSGSTHRYVFTLYALDAILELDAGVTKGTLTETIEGRDLATVALTCEYGR